MWRVAGIWKRQADGKKELQSLARLFCLEPKAQLMAFFDRQTALRWPLGRISKKMNNAKFLHRRHCPTTFTSVTLSDTMRRWLPSTLTSWWASGGRHQSRVAKSTSQPTSMTWQITTCSRPSLSVLLATCAFMVSTVTCLFFLIVKWIEVPICIRIASDYSTHSPALEMHTKKRKQLTAFRKFPVNRLVAHLPSSMHPRRSW